MMPVCRILSMGLFDQVPRRGGQSTARAAEGAAINA